MDNIHTTFNIEEYYKNNAAAEGWQREQFFNVVQKLEEMTIDELRIFCERIGNSNDKNFFDTAPYEQLVQYLFSDVDRESLIRELGL